MKSVYEQQKETYENLIKLYSEEIFNKMMQASIRQFLSVNVFFIPSTETEYGRLFALYQEEFSDDAQFQFSMGLNHSKNQVYNIIRERARSLPMYPSWE